MITRTELERARRASVATREAGLTGNPIPDIAGLAIVDALDELDREDAASFEGTEATFVSYDEAQYLTDKELAEQAGYPVPDKKLPGYVYKHLPEANEAEQDDLKYLKGFVIGVLAATITIGVVNMLVTAYG